MYGEIKIIKISIIDAEHKADIGISNEPFKSFGKIEVSFKNGQWDYELVRFNAENVAEMRFPDENYDFDSMKDSVFIGAYDEDACVGLLVLQPACFKYMHIADIKVNKKYRRQNIGGALIEKAKEAAAQLGYRGLYLECQDNNPGAFMFYVKSGFYIGGLNTNVYKYTKQEGKADIILYCDNQK